jgi:hypothetical protein
MWYVQYFLTVNNFFLTVSNFLRTVIHMIIMPAYASLCVTTTQNGNGFHHEVSRGFLLFHDTLCMAGWPNLPFPLIEDHFFMSKLTPQFGFDQNRYL